jgi:hypothetical protein
MLTKKTYHIPSRCDKEQQTRSRKTSTTSKKQNDGNHLVGQGSKKQGSKLKKTSPTATQAVEGQQLDPK